MEQLSTEELKRRASGLLALGNSPARIRKTLEGLGASPEQIDEVMSATETRLQQKERADSRYVWWLVGAVGLLMSMLVCIAVLLFEPSVAPVSAENTALSPTQRPQGTRPPAPIQAQTLLPGIPEGLIPKEIPTNIPQDFMVATPVVITGGSAGGSRAATCPKSSLEAANVFGGDPGNWQYDMQTNGWTMTNVGPGVPITVPGGMTAGFMTIVESIEMVSVEGPATIENVNFIAISCP